MASQGDMECGVLTAWTGQELRTWEVLQRVHMKIRELDNSRYQIGISKIQSASRHSDILAPRRQDPHQLKNYALSMGREEDGNFQVFPLTRGLGV